jgi:DNA-binding GntR family transcriptional regulator
MKENVYDTIKSRILSLGYQPGEAISENSLSREFGLSRSPLREVLMKLEWEQLVRSVPRTGRIVSEINFEQMMNVYRVRLMIEPLVGMLAAEYRTDADLDSLTSLVIKCRKLARKKNIPALVNISFQFRDALHAAAGNKELTFVSTYLYNLTHRVFYLVAAKGDWPQETRLLAEEITQVHRALKKKDAEEAARLRQEALELFIERVKHMF